MFASRGLTALLLVVGLLLTARTTLIETAALLRRLTRKDSDVDEAGGQLEVHGGGS